MNLEHVSAEKSPNKFPEYCPKPIQLSIFPKVSLRPACRVSNEQIERFIQRISANRLCREEEVRDYLRRQLRRNCRPSTIRSSSATILLFSKFF